MFFFFFFFSQVIGTKEDLSLSRSQNDRSNSTGRSKFDLQRYKKWNEVSITREKVYSYEFLEKKKEKTFLLTFNCIARIDIISFGFEDSCCIMDTVVSFWFVLFYIFYIFYILLILSFVKLKEKSL